MCLSHGVAGREVAFGDSVAMSIAENDEAQLTGVFNGLSEGGTVTMPPAKRVWGDTFGMLTCLPGCALEFHVTP